jgi:hypothetical protein
MKFSISASLGALTATALANSFEPSDFNVTEALVDNGVNISAIPGLAGLVERSSLNGCSIAVGCLEHHHRLLQEPTH